MAAWNPADKHANIALSGSNLVATKSGANAWNAVRADTSVTSGKIYWEMVLGNNVECMMGAQPAAGNLDYPGSHANGYGYRKSVGTKYNNAAQTAYGDAYGTGSVISIAIDFTAGKIWFAKNGTWQNSGDPVAGTGEAFSGVTGPIFPCVGIFTNTGFVTARFDNGSFSYTMPTGYTDINGAVPSTGNNPSIGSYGIIGSGNWI